MQAHPSTPQRPPTSLSPGAGKGSPADPLLQRLPQEKLREVTDVNFHGYRMLFVKCSATVLMHNSLQVRTRMRQGWGAGEGTPTSLALRWEAWLHQVTLVLA
jgi:hypothetical protein